MGTFNVVFHLETLLLTVAMWSIFPICFIFSSFISTQELGRLFKSEIVRNLYLLNVTLQDLLTRGGCSMFDALKFAVFLFGTGKS